jgi:hypothetical protein
MCNVRLKNNGHVCVGQLLTFSVHTFKRKIEGFKHASKITSVMNREEMKHAKAGEAVSKDPQM